MHRVRLADRECTEYGLFGGMVLHSFFLLFFALAGGCLTSDVSEVIGAMIVVRRAAVVKPRDPARKGWGNRDLGSWSPHH